MQRRTLLLIAVLLPLAQAHAQTFNLFSTGVNASSVPLPAAAIDPHYIIGVGDTSLAEVLTNQNPGGYVQSATSRWIWDAANGLPVGTLDFYTTFTLTAQDINTGVTLSGLYATDDNGSVFLNNTNLNANNSGPSSFTSFNTSSGLIVGLNTLKFTVPNISGVGGLNVDQLQYTVGSSAAPEPGTLGLLALGALGAAGVLRRRRTR